MKAHVAESDQDNKVRLRSLRGSHFVNVVAPAILVILTVCTTVMTGVLVSGSEYLTLAAVLKGLPYATGALVILGAHAFGHFIQARLCKVKAYPPYFIPALGFVGTVGAYTKIHWPISDRKTLIKIFATGPICGFIASWIVLCIGLFFSKIIDVPSVSSSVKMGDSIIMHITSVAFFGSLPVTKDVRLHPAAYAGWLGLFYNFCHLLPIGRFDGGRLVYALWGYRVTRWVSFISIVTLLIVGYFSPDWMTWIALAVVGTIASIGFRGQYPVERYDQPLARSILVVLGIIGTIFIISFTPIPLPTLKQ